MLAHPSFVTSAPPLPLPPLGAMQGTTYAHQWWWTMSAALFILLWIGMMCVEMGGAFFDGYMFHSALLAIAARQLTGAAPTGARRWCGTWSGRSS